MSFLLDPALLIGTGTLIGAKLGDEDADKAETATLCLFYGISIPLYLNAPGSRAFGRAFGAESGRDFMLNSGWFSLGRLNFDAENPGPKTHLASAAIFATYPIWLRIGRVIGRRLAASRRPVPGASAVPDISPVEPVRAESEAAEATSA